MRISDWSSDVCSSDLLKNPKATQEAFAGGWFHSGDLAVLHPGGYMQIKDRSKDIIISGGENISTLEVEGVLYMHPDILEAAVVARPEDRKSTRLNSSLMRISYAVFCLKKKKKYQK